MFAISLPFIFAKISAFFEIFVHENNENQRHYAINKIEGFRKYVSQSFVIKAESARHESLDLGVLQNNPCRKNTLKEIFNPYVKYCTAKTNLKSKIF